MADLNINKGNDPNQQNWGLTDQGSTQADEGTANKTDGAKSTTAQFVQTNTYTQSTIVQSAPQQEIPSQQFIPTNANQPKLPLPNPNAKFDQEALEVITNPLNLFGNNLSIIPMPPEAVLTPEQEAECYNSAAVTDPEVLKMSKDGGIDPGRIQKFLGSEYNTKLTEILQQGLSPEEADQLLFAHFFPDIAPPLPPKLKEILTKAENAAAKYVQVQHNQPEGWKPTVNNLPQGDVKEFQEQITEDFDQTFNEVLDKYAQENNLPTTTVSQLKAMHFGQEVSPDENVQKIFNNLEKQAVTIIQQKYGTGSNWTPQANTANFTNMLIGAFRQEISDGIKKINPKLSSEEEQELLKYLDDPSTPVSPKIKKIAQQLKAASIKKVQAQFGLSESWVPETDSVKPSMVSKDISSKVQSAINMGRNMLKSYEHIFDQVNGEKLPGFSTILYREYLLVIGKQLDQLQQELYAVQGINSASASKLSNMKLDTMKNQLKKQQEEVDRIREQQSKQKSLGPLADMNGWIGKVMMIAVAALLSVVTAGMSLVLTTAYLVDQIQAESRHDTPLVQQMFKAVMKSIGSKELGILVCTLIVIAMSMCNANPMMAVSLLCTDSRVIQNFVACCGGNKMAQEITAMVISMVFNMLVTLVMSLLTGGGAMPAMAATAIATVTGISTKAVMIFVQIFFMAWTLIQASLQITQNAITINNELILAEIEKIKGRLEASQEELQAMINMLKKIIAAILEALQGTADFIANISKFQGDKFDKLSAITTRLQQAS